MTPAPLSQEFELEYDVAYREFETPTTIRDMCSKERFNTQARYSRTSKGRAANGSHRRRDKRNNM